MPTPPSSFNSGVFIEAVRRRLGHASTETTQLYALLDDKVADAEIAPHAADGAGQRADRPCAEQARRNRVYLVTAVLPTLYLDCDSFILCGTFAGDGCGHDRPVPRW